MTPSRRLSQAVSASGTPAVTSRGMKEEDMDKIAEAVAMVIKEQENGIAGARAIVQALTEKYPLI